MRQGHGTGDTPLALTDLGHARPTSRGGGEASPTAKRKRQLGAKSESNARINQIAVASANKSAYAVDGDGQRGETTEKPSIPMGHAALQRSQTAPNGLRRPQSNTGESGSPGVGLDTSRPVSSQRAPDKRVQRPPPLVVARAIEGGDEDDDEVSPTQHDAKNVPRSTAKRPYGEMIDCNDVETLCQRLGMAQKDVWKLRKAFNDEDTDNTNTITITSFFYIIHEEKWALTKSLLRLAGLTSPSQTRLSFDEFLRCVTTFASFTEPEVLQFFFQVYSDNAASSGGARPKARAAASSVVSMVESDLMKLGQDLQVLRTAFAGNIKNATSEVVTTSSRGVSVEGNWTFADFERFSRQHMVAFYPLIQIQRNVRLAGGLGEPFWIQKTRDKVQLQSTLAYMKKNHGLLPPLRFKDRVLSFVLQRSTTATRVRDLATRLYAR